MILRYTQPLGLSGDGARFRGRAASATRLWVTSFPGAVACAGRLDHNTQGRILPPACLPSSTSTADTQDFSFLLFTPFYLLAWILPCVESHLVLPHSPSPHRPRYLPVLLASDLPRMSDQSLAQRSPRSRKSLSTGISFGNQENQALLPSLSAGKKGKGRAASIGGVELMGARAKPLLSPKKAARRAAVSQTSYSGSFVTWRRSLQRRRGHGRCGCELDNKGRPNTDGADLV